MSSILVPISVGELLDKITILRIKMVNIQDAQKRQNVSKELEALNGVCAVQKIDTESALVKELENINSKLWVVEDALRDKERSQSFDKEFLELARSVYFLNDTRAEVKKKINLATGSQFVEEKSYQPYR